MTLADVSDTGLIAQLRAKLREVEDERDAQARAIASLNTELGQLRAALQGEVDELDPSLVDPKTAVTERRGSAFWFAAWRNATRRQADRAIRVIELERWMKEAGEELARLQTRNALLQRIADTVRGHEPFDTLGEIAVHHPDGGPGVGLFDAIDHANKVAAT